jgi:DNA polymerase I-like protein with 3'-5' exonuclease and polymerase domains
MSVITDANHKEYHRAIRMLNGETKEWAYDIESDGLDVRNGNIIGFGISNGLKGFYFCHKYWDGNELKEALSKEECLRILKLLSQKKLIMWNGSFDCRFTYHYFGIDLVPSLYIEGMLAKHTMDEERPFGLKDVGVKIYGDQEKKEQLDLYESIKVNGGTRTEYYKADKDIMGKYCIQDCHLTFRLAFNYVTKMDKQLENFFFRDEVMPLYKEVTIPMEMLGVPLDIKGLEQQQSDIASDIERLEKRIQTLISPLLKDVFEPWYLEKTYHPKRTGPFAQALCKYANLSLPHTGSGAYSLTRKALESLEYNTSLQHVAREFLLDKSTLPNDIVREIQLSMVKGYMFNLQSNHHLKKLFFETLKEESLSKTPTGQPQVNDEFMDVMGMKYEWAKLLIDYNKLTKIKGTYIDRFLNEAEDGIFYPSFFQHRTISGRYGSDLQQLPRPLEESQASSMVRKYNNQLRKNFIAGENYVFIDSDYESLEPHVFAHVSGDTRLKDIFRSGRDFYSTIAIATEKLDGVSAVKSDKNYLGRVNKQLRQKAKAYSLGIPYGLEAYGLSKQLDVHQSEAKLLIENYLNAYPQLKAWMERTNEKVVTTGEVRSQAGRVRHMPKAPKIWSDNGPIILDSLKLWTKWNGSKKYAEKKLEAKEIKKALNNGKNFQIQSLAASITNRACIAIARELKRKGIEGHVCAQIHDQIVVRVPESEAERWRKSVQFMMENTYRISIPLKAPAEIANDFYEGH